MRNGNSFIYARTIPCDLYTKRLNKRKSTQGDSPLEPTARAPLVEDAPALASLLELSFTVSLLYTLVCLYASCTQPYASCTQPYVQADECVQPPMTV